MNERLVWIVRLIGIVVFLVLMYLLLSLHTQLIRMNESAGDSPSSSERKAPTSGDKPALLVEMWSGRGPTTT